MIPYGFITYLGFFYRDMKPKNKIVLSLGSVVVFAVITAALWYKDGTAFNITDYKYPAQIYFLSYALPIIFILLELLPRYDKFEPSRLVKFISKSSLWIYLWHILVLYAVKMFIENPSYWWVQYVIIVFVSTGITWVQNKIVDCLSSKYHFKFLRIFKG